MGSNIFFYLLKFCELFFIYIEWYGDIGYCSIFEVSRVFVECGEFFKVTKVEEMFVVIL